MDKKSVFDAIFKAVDDINKENSKWKEVVQKSRKRIFVPLLIEGKDDWIYFPGTYFKYKGREIAVLQPANGVGIPCDPKNAVTYSRHPISLDECSEYCFRVLLRITDSDYIKTVLKNERKYKQVEKERGPKPPTRIFDGNDPEAMKFEAKIIKENEDLWK